jgi:hypothetical protein
MRYVDGSSAARQHAAGQGRKKMGGEMATVLEKRSPRSQALAARRRSAPNGTIMYTAIAK